MGNFYKDNDDIRFLFQHLDMLQLYVVVIL